MLLHLSRSNFNGLPCTVGLTQGKLVDSLAYFPSKMSYFALRRCMRRHWFRADMAQPLFSLTHAEPSDLSTRQADVLRVIGFLQLQFGDPSDAAVLFDALHSLVPSDRNIALSLALARLRSGDPLSALEVLDEAMPTRLSGEQTASDLRRDVLSPCHHLLRGQALASLGRMAEAARAMRLFIRHRRLLDNQTAI